MKAAVRTFLLFLLSLTKNSNSSRDYRNGDFKAYYCTTQKRHIWTLGYFGGGAINFDRFKQAAEDFANTIGVPIECVKVDEILYSRRYKHFKFLTADAKGQTPLEESYQTDDVMKWLHD